VALFFAETGRMLGVAAKPGRAWTKAAVIQFLVMDVLAFGQRAVTGKQDGVDAWLLTVR
jgi:hypothetical protein